MALPEKPTIGIIGTGAIGGYYGALLARAGHEVRFLLRSDYETVVRDGLTIELSEPEERFTIQPARACQSPDEMGQVDLVIIALKATANERLPDLLRPITGPDTILLTLQNGMGNVELLREHFPGNRVLGALCFICLNRLGPGVIRNFYPGYIALGESRGEPGEDATNVAALFEKDAGVRCRLSNSLDEALWRKLCWNIPFNGLAIAGGSITTDRILARPALVELARALMEEVRAAAGACGHEIPEDFLDRQFRVTEPMGAYRPSSLIDFTEGRDVEVEAIFGEPLRRGTAAGVPMPRLDTLYLLLRGLVDERKTG